MRWSPNADCMASSANPNPYGQQPQAQQPQVGGEAPLEFYYAPGSYYGQQQPPATAAASPDGRLRHQQSLLSGTELVKEPAGGLVRSGGSLAASYESASYLAGMASDSELTAASAAARHHHHHHHLHHHHRPYSSHSRVYHAHPMSRNQQSQQQSAAQQQQQQQQQQQHLQSSTSSSLSQFSNSAANMQSIGSLGGPAGYLPSPSGSAGASAPASGESPLSPLMMQQQQAGRQLPQRPFKHSMSIDQQPMLSSHQQLQQQQQLQYQQQQQQQQQLAHSPAHQRKFLSEPLPGSTPFGGAPYGRLTGELEMVEKQAAAMSLYEPNEISADLPPMNPARPVLSSSSGGGGAANQPQRHQRHQRHLPSVNSAGAMPMSAPGQLQQQQQLDPFQQQRLLHQSSQDPYMSRQQQLQQQQQQQRAYFGPNMAQEQQQQQQQLNYSPQHLDSSHQHLQQQQQQHSMHHNEHHHQHQKQFDRASTMDGRPRPKLQHQPSSNLSGPLMSAAPQDSHEYQKSLPSASPHQQAAGFKSQQQQQHQSGRHPEGLRRGHTSAAVSMGPGQAGAGRELAGSQGALSECGADLSQSLSLSQASGHSGQLGKRSAAMRAASPSLGHEQPGPSGGGAHHQPGHQQHHSASSGHSMPSASRGDPAAGLRSESSTGLPNGPGTSSTLTKKSNSATQLSMSGTKKRLGFRKKQVTSFSVHRSEEVAPLEARHLVKQGSSVSEGDSSMSGDSSSRSWSNSNFKQQTSEELASMSFIDGLGKGQMISRQGLASPYLGDIQLSLCDRRGNLEIEVIRARNLQAKTNKVQPLTYVKLYLVKNRKCLGKAKTTLSNKRTLNPLFQQQLTFHEDYHGCILQSIVWGNFGKMDKKNFMGIAQISIDDLELSDTVISWYKLFLPSSLQTLPSKSLRHTLLSNSTESFTNTNNS